MQDLVAEVASLRAMLAARTACAACAALAPPPLVSAGPATCGAAPAVLSHCSDMSRPAARCAAPTAGVPGPRPGITRKPRKPRSRAVTKPAGQSRYWTPDEHKLFLAALNMYGHKDLKAISAHVGTRNMTQVRTHSQKYFMRLMREAKRQNPTPIESEDTTNTSQAIETTGTSPALAKSVPVMLATPSTPASPTSDNEGSTAAVTVAPTRAPSPAPTPTQTPTPTATPTPSVAPVVDSKEKATCAASGAIGDKYSVPSSCGLTLLSLVGQDTLSTA